MLPDLSGMNPKLKGVPFKRRAIDPSSLQQWSGIVGDPIRNSDNDVLESKMSPFKLLPESLKKRILMEVVLEFDKFNDTASDKLVCDRVSQLCYSVTKDTKPGESNAFAPPWINCDDDTFWDELNFQMNFYNESVTENYRWEQFRQDRMEEKVIFMEQTTGFWRALNKHDNVLPPFASKPPSTPKEHFQYMCRKSILTNMNIQTYIDLLTDYKWHLHDSYLHQIFNVFGISNDNITANVFIPKFKEIAVKLATFQDNEGDKFSTELEKAAVITFHEQTRFYKRFREEYRLNSGNEFAISIMQIDSDNLAIMEDNFKDDEDVVYAAVMHWNQSIQWASERLKRDKTFLMRIVSAFLNNPYQYYKEYQGVEMPEQIFFDLIYEDVLKDDEFMRLALKLDGSLLGRAPESIKNDYNFVKEIVLETSRTNSNTRLPAYIFADPIVIDLLRREGHYFNVY